MEFSTFNKDVAHLFFSCVLYFIQISLQIKREQNEKNILQVLFVHCTKHSIETKLNELKPISSTNMLAVYSRLKYAFMITFHL